MYGQSDCMREDQENLCTLDVMVSVAKKALETIIEIHDNGEGWDDIGYIASKAMVDIMKAERDKKYRDKLEKEFNKE